MKSGSKRTKKSPLNIEILLMDVNCGLWVLSAIAMTLFIIFKENPQYDNFAAGLLIFLIGAFLATAMLAHLTGDKIFGWAMTGMAIAWVAGAFLIPDAQNYAMLFYISVVIVSVVAVWRSFVWFGSERRTRAGGLPETVGTPPEEKITPR